MQSSNRSSWVLLLSSTLFAACSSLPPGEPLGGGADEERRAQDPAPPDAPPHSALSDRELDYGEALRTASFKLVGAPPSLAQIKQVTSAKNQKAAYEKALDAMLADKRFSRRMIKWWKDVFKTGGPAADGKPSRDTAATLAARVVVEERPFTAILTSPSNNCPSYDDAKEEFQDGDCNNGVPAEAGVITNPGIQMQFYSNMAMRRVRWLQEIFVCTKFPAEYGKNPQKMGAGEYVSPWPFDSVSTSPVDFQDTKAAICANCHTTINHIAPLLGHFDANGQWSPDLQVMTPTAPNPTPTQLDHWLASGEKTAWRHGEQVDDLAMLGQAMAGDPDVAACAVTRAYDFAMSKRDVVNDLATVPDDVLSPALATFYASGMNFKKTLRAVFASDDFIRF